MRPVPSSSLLLASLALVFGCTSSDADPAAIPEFARVAGGVGPPEARNFVAVLRVRDEVPLPEETTTANPTGQTKFQLARNGPELSYRLIASNIRGVTQAHIHCGAEGVSGPVVAFLFGLVADGVNSNGVLAEGTLTNADVIARPDSGVCPGGVANFDEMIAKIRAGEAYVNVHTTLNAPGEIRGQIRVAGPGS